MPVSLAIDLDATYVLDHVTELAGNLEQAQALHVANHRHHESFAFQRRAHTDAETEGARTPAPAAAP